MDKEFKELTFTVDAELLRELGERLVGKHHVALAELIKNSYDADATEVTIKFFPNEDQIEIHDNGHGMTFEDFENFWMRIGSTHKREKIYSSDLERTMTGSKGVGRLAVQFLANKLELKTVSEKQNVDWLQAAINWENAIKDESELTKVKVKCNLHNSGRPVPQGTSIILEGLKHEWDSDSIRDLALELWWLQPPFGSSSLDTPKDRFRIRFQSTQQDFEKEFSGQMNAVKGIWIARLVGKCIDGELIFSLEFSDGEKIIHNYNIRNFDHNDRKFNKNMNLNTCRFEIRIYNLKGKQKFGIKVGEAREYFEKHGGVHVYDGGFRLPYYGLSESDWLELEYAHSHRQTVSKLLPENIQKFPKALHNLPTLGRVLGVVNVNTSNEPNLNIMVTRDRLTETTAYEDLKKTIRFAFDWYANETTRRKIEEKKQETSTEPISLKFDRVEKVLEAYESDIPKEIYKDIYNEVQEVTIAVKNEQELVLEQMGMLASLATAGISALSYQHELKKQFAYIENTINRMKNIETMSPELQKNLQSLSADLASWLKRAKATNLLFDYIADTENTQLRHNLRARVVIEDITNQTHFLARDTKVDYSQIDGNLRLPKASYAEWGAIFQNIFINAFTAMLDSPKRLLHISSRSHDKNHKILIQDTGYGINLDNAEKFFKPFERESKISPERKALGYGGTGLGLTIVQLVADNIGCHVRFVEPQKGFKTAFLIQWREDK